MKRSIRENVPEETSCHSQEEISDLISQSRQIKKQRNQMKVTDEKTWTKTAEEWTEVSRDDESYDWREHQWPYLIAKSESSLLKFLLDCHRGTGKKCQLDTLLDRESIEKSTSVKKINYIEYPQVMVAQPVESYIEVLPSQKMPDEWVLGGGSSMKTEELEQEETPSGT